MGAASAKQTTRDVVDVVTVKDWTGSWELVRRENWKVYLGYCGVPDAAHEAAEKAPDWHRYRVDMGAFTMDHQIPGQKLHLHFRSDINGQWQDSPYPRPTVAHWADGKEAKLPCWRHQWVQPGVHFKTEIPNFLGKEGKTLHLERHLVSASEIKMTAHIKEGEALVIGPCYTYAKKVSDNGPAPISYLRKKGKSLATAEQRIEALEQVFKMVSENLDAISDAQEADRVVPARFNPGQLQGACRMYQSLVAEWMEPEILEDTCPKPLTGGVEASFTVVKEPKGVCINVSPWNAPMTLSVIPMLGMLAAGNHVVVKPPDQTPAFSATFRRLCQKYLHGYVWVEEGGKDAVERLIDEGADHLVFTGGAEIAKHVAARCAMMLTPVTLELGGKSPLFIDSGLSESVLNDAVREVLELKVYKTGQFCCAHDYALVHGDIYNSFTEKLKAAIEGLGEKRHVRLLGRRQYEAVKAKLDSCPGERMPPMQGAYQPDDENMTIPFTCLPGATQEDLIMKEEVFGPLLPILKVAGAEEAIQIINGLPTGKPLIAYCYSETPENISAFSSLTSSGMLAINSGPMRMISNHNAGIGGIGPSGTGRSMWGKEALREFSNRKHVVQAQKGCFAKSYFSGPPAAAD